MNLDAYLQPLAPWAVRPQWPYRFPNGHRVNVLIDDNRPFRFRLDHFGSDCLSGLSTAEVEAKLAEVAALPAHNPN
jgi:hypothetical protein